MNTNKTLLLLATIFGCFITASLTACGDEDLEDAFKNVSGEEPEDSTWTPDGKLGFWLQGKFVEFEQISDTCFYVQYMAERDSTTDIEALLRATVNIEMQYGKGYIITAEGIPSIPGFFVSAFYRAYLRPQPVDGVLVLPNIALKLTENSKFEDMMAKYGNLIIVKSRYDTTYLVDCNLYTSDEVLRLAARLYHEDYVVWSEPNLWGNLVYYDAGRDWIDFMHTVKPRPKAPIHIIKNDVNTN